MEEFRPLLEKIREIVREEVGMCVASEVGGIKQDVAELKQDMSIVKQDVGELKQDVALLKQDVCELRQETDRRFDIVSHQNNETNERFDRLTDQMHEFRNEVLSREDATVSELKKYNQEISFLGLRVTRIENSFRPAG